MNPLPPGRVRPPTPGFGKNGYPLDHPSNAPSAGHPLCPMLDEPTPCPCGPDYRCPDPNELDETPATLAPSAGQDTERLRDEVRDGIAGWPIGSGYYGTTVGIDEAGDIADELLDGPLRLLIAERDEAREANSRYIEAGARTMRERDEALAQVQRVREALDAPSSGYLDIEIRRALDGQT